MSRARLLALDVDGTAMTYGGEVSDELRTAVAAVVDAGVHVVLATGRSLRAAADAAEQIGLAGGWLVCSNGAVVARLDAAEPAGYELVKVVTFDPAPAVRVLAAELPDALYAVENLGVGYLVTAPFPPGELTGEIEVVPFERLLAAPASRVVVRAVEATPDEFHELVDRVGLHEVSYAVGWSAWLDLAPGGVSKASALEELRQRLGVEPFATVAIGDGSNDVEMLRWAARGVAMGHAAERVRAAADEVTGTIDDDGAVAVLRSLLV
jgi:hydroxymethylpyrimidine pyrophosphatase-like HAD family hydrolase